MENKMVIGLVSEIEIKDFELTLHDPKPDIKPHLYLVK